MSRALPGTPAERHRHSLRAGVATDNSGPAAELDPGAVPDLLRWTVSTLCIWRMGLSNCGQGLGTQTLLFGPSGREQLWMASLILSGRWG